MELTTLSTMESVKHINNANCPKCEQIFNKYPGFHEGLKSWFKAIQKNNPEAHISCAGRGKADQEQFFKQGSSKAHYGQSAHSWNLALDIFKLSGNGAEWPKDWFSLVIGSAVDKQNSDPLAVFKIEWYGKPGSPFFELPHCQVAGWQNLSMKKLVEPL